MISGRQRERRAIARAASGVAFAMIAQQVAGKATRDAFFLSMFPASDLPLVMAVSAVLSFVVVMTLARLMTRLSPARVVPAAFAVSGGLFALEWLLAADLPRVAAVLTYFHTAAIGAALVSSFWSVINETFDPYHAKKVVTRIAGGATLGGVVGGLLAWQVGAATSARVMLAVLAGINAVAALGMLRVRSKESERAIETDSEASVSAFKVVKEAPYLRHLALLVGLVAFGEAVIDYVFKARAAGALPTGEQLISFFAIFYTVVGVVTFLFQSALARRSLERFGLTGTVATLPVTVSVGSALAVLFPGLWPVIALRGGAASIGNSLYRSGYELLYTPLSPAKKRATKALIDVGADRIGTALGAGVAFVALALLPGVVDESLLILSGGAAVASLVVASLLHGGYVASLAESLMRGTVILEEANIVDATTKRTLASTSMAMDRDKLLAEIATLRDSQPVLAPVAESSAANNSLLTAVADLRSADVARIRRALSGETPIDLALVPLVIELLSRDEVQADAVAALRRVAERATGQLVDALLDGLSPAVIRRRIPRVLVSSPTQRAFDGLIRGLSDEHFEVRYRCAAALARMSAANSDLSVPGDRIFRAAEREAEAGEAIWEQHQLVDEHHPEEEPPFPAAERRRIGRRLEHIFALLSLVLDREPLTLAFRALAGESESLRGTGLEYLENVLPSPIRELLWPFLGDRRVTEKPPRKREEIVDDLFTSMSHGQMDAAAVRRAIDEE